MLDARTTRRLTYEVIALAEKRDPVDAINDIELALVELRERRNTMLLKASTARWLKVECTTCEYVARVTKKWLESTGAPLCPCNSQAMTIC